MKLIFSDPAVNDLKRLREFIAYKNPDAAQRIAEKLYNSIAKLVDYPQIGRPVDELPGEIREMISGQYIVRYEVREYSLYILRIWHSKEDRIV